ncbi:MAG: hypothetical protein JW803_08645 [Endomicrobiales bacterium]|nr:hypothetical protein [Endomicrobiales bacterium]
MIKRIAILVLSVFACSAASAATAEEMKANNRLMGEYYKVAMEAFHKEDFTRAISHWNEILKIDPEQKQAQNLIDMARQRMSEKIKPTSDQMEKLIDSGKYNLALPKSRELLALDPGNAKWETISTKLQKITVIVAQETGAGKTETLIRKSAGAYLSYSENPRLAVNAARYANQTDPKNARAADLKEFMEDVYRQYSQRERVISGMNVVEQKLQASLSNIYDGKYDLAIIECTDVIDIEPKNVLAYKRAGSAYYASGNKKKAKEIWARAAKISPKDKELRKFLKLK